jgi:septum formation protein
MIPPLVLASTSPRRREILNYFTIPWEIIPHTFDERSLPYEGESDLYVQALAKEKALSVAKKFPHRTIIAADTIVIHQGTLLHKAKDKTEAFAMLQTLADSSHMVSSGIAVYHEGQCMTDFDKTTVYIRKLNDQQIEAFLDTSLWTDKTGAYAIQGVGSLLVERIEGCYYNVIGLPVIPLSRMLKEIGIDLWKYLRTHAHQR